MSRATKTLLVIFGSVLGVVLLMVVATLVWWGFNEKDIKAAAQASVDTGFEAGKVLVETACVSQGLERFKNGNKLDVASAMSQSFWVSGCLESAKVSDNFCSGMPEAENLMALHAWASTICAQRGVHMQYCSSIIGLVPRYCASTIRADKLKALQGTDAKPQG